MRLYECYNCLEEIKEREAKIVEREVNLMDYEYYEALINKLNLVHSRGSGSEFFEHGGAVLCRECAKLGGCKTL